MRCMIAFSLLSLAWAFTSTTTTTTTSTSPTSPTRLNAATRDQWASGVAAALFLAANVATSPAWAFDDSSQLLIAARSGGRAGGRAYKAPVQRSSTTIYQTSPSTVYMTPPSYYGASPFSGMSGLYLGLSTVGAVNDALREARQQQQIARSQEELQQAKMKEMELEMRLRQLEGQQQPMMAAPQQQQ